MEPAIIEHNTGETVTWKQFDTSVSAIAAKLLEQGESVRILDDFSSGRRENLEGLRGKLEVIIAKQRNGPTDTVELSFIKETMQVAEPADYMSGSGQ